MMNGRQSQSFCGKYLYIEIKMVRSKTFLSVLVPLILIAIFLIGDIIILAISYLSQSSESKQKYFDRGIFGIFFACDLGSCITEYFIEVSHPALASLRLVHPKSMTILPLEFHTAKHSE